MATFLQMVRKTPAMKKLLFTLLLILTLFSQSNSNATSPTSTSLRIFPQPVLSGESVYLQWQAVESAKLDIQLFDILGNRIFQGKLNRLETGLYRFDFPQRPRPGYYFLQLESEGLQARQRIQVN